MLVRVCSISEAHLQYQRGCAVLTRYISILLDVSRLHPVPSLMCALDTLRATNENVKASFHFYSTETRFLLVLRKSFVHFRDLKYKSVPFHILQCTVR